jgi:hypothetical protein
MLDVTREDNVGLVRLSKYGDLEILALCDDAEK